MVGEERVHHGADGVGHERLLREAHRDPEDGGVDLAGGGAAPAAVWARNSASRMSGPLLTVGKNVAQAVSAPNGAGAERPQYTSKPCESRLNV